MIGEKTVPPISDSWEPKPKTGGLGPPLISYPADLTRCSGFSHVRKAVSKKSNLLHVTKVTQ